MSSPGPKDDVPAFARGFPAEVRLDAMVAAFKDGNYARVRREGREVLESSASDEVKSAAKELVSRTEADPLMVGLLVVTGVLLAVLSGYWMAHGGH